MSATPLPPPAIELVGIDKRFGPVHANKNINLSVAKGTIHGIVGENGAGKSTLMSILYGFYHPDAGTIRVNGKEIADPLLRRGDRRRHRHGAPALHAGRAVHGAGKRHARRRGRHAAEGAASRMCAASCSGSSANTRWRSIPTPITGELPVGLQQRVEILKALYRGADTLILDEPTGVLTPDEADHLFRILRQLKEQGKTIILITHKLREIMAVTDEVSVMRRGEMVATRKTAETTPEELAELMVGRRVLLRVDEEAGQSRRAAACRSRT